MAVSISPSQGAQFDLIVHKKPCVAKFHRPGCHYCVELEPIWNLVLKSKQIADLNFSFLNVHSEAIPNIKSKCAENIVGVPTIMIIYNNGTSRKVHKNANDFDSIVKFIIDNKNLLGQNGGANYKKSRSKKLTKKKHLRSRKRLKYTKHKKHKKYKKHKKQKGRTTKRIS